MPTLKKLFLAQRSIPLEQMTTPEQQKLINGKSPWPVQYHVTKVVQSTELNIGDVLTKGDVELFCKDDSWQVEIT